MKYTVTQQIFQERGFTFGDSIVEAENIEMHMIGDRMMCRFTDQQNRTVAILSNVHKVLTDKVSAVKVAD